MFHIRLSIDESNGIWDNFEQHYPYFDFRDGVLMKIVWKTVI